MTRVRGRSVRVLAAIGAGIVIASLAPAMAADARAPMYGAPKAGTCYRVAGKIAWGQNSTTAKPVVCSKKHTLWIVKVVKVPAKYKWSSNKYWNYAGSRCATATKRKLGDFGKKYGMSAYYSFELGPTKAQRTKGAHWVSCEIGIQAGGENLVVTKQKIPTKVTGALPKRLRLCGTVHSDELSTTNCALPHNVRAAKDEVVAATSANIAGKATTFCAEASRPWMTQWSWIAPERAIITCLY